MALTATLFKLVIAVSDIDRGVYETLELKVAQQPLETPEYMVMRVLAYCLESGEGITFTEGVAAGDEPGRRSRRSGQGSSSPYHPAGTWHPSSSSPSSPSSST